MSTISNRTSNTTINTINTKNTTNTKNTINNKLNSKNNGLLQDYNYLVILLILLLFIGLIYTNTKSYLVNKTLRTLTIIEGYQQISSFSNDETIKLKNMKIASSYNTIGRYRCLFDYQDPKILKKILSLGVRYIELNIFSDTFEYGSKPMVTNGIKEGQWKLMLNSVRFGECLKIIKDNAFSKKSNLGGSPNSDDPLFLGLNVHTGTNIGTLDDVAAKIIRELGQYLLPSQYSYQHDNNFHDIKIGLLKKKLVIFSSQGIEGSRLEELVNATWTDETKLTQCEEFTNYLSNKEAFSMNDPESEPLFSEDKKNESSESNLLDTLVETLTNKKNIIRIPYSLIIKYGFNCNWLKEHNKNGLTIVTPNKEGDIFPMNYDPNPAFELGCQFVCMNYQYLNSNLDKYILSFRKKSIIEL